MLARCSVGPEKDAEKKSEETKKDENKTQEAMQIDDVKLRYRIKVSWAQTGQDVDVVHTRASPPLLSTPPS